MQAGNFTGLRDRSRGCVQSLSPSRVYYESDELGIVFDVLLAQNTQSQMRKKSEFKRAVEEAYVEETNSLADVSWQ